MRFNGPEYDPGRDGERLKSQFITIFNCMSDAEWRTLGEIAKLTGYPEASISAQLRHARKKRFGSHTVNRQHVSRGLFRYQLVVNAEPSEEDTLTA